MIRTMTEDFDLWEVDPFCEKSPFVFACRDRMVKDEERWVLAALTRDEARLVYEYLDKHLNK